MILNLRKVLLASITILVFSCAEDTSEKYAEYEKLFQQVLEVHDEVMPKMGDLPGLEQQLQKIADTSANPRIYLEAEKQLERSDSLMMGWMHSFSDEFVKKKPSVKKMSNQEIQQEIDALQAELKKVRRMEDEISASLINAQELVR
ncbi:MAG: hypothetical protein CME35_08465 [Gramella sp.]|nr:hypothetical protein [Christiangramia sp.]